MTDATVRLTLQPLSLADAKVYDEQDQGLRDSPHAFTGYRPINGVQKRFGQDGYIGTDTGALAIYVGDNFVGLVSWYLLKGGYGSEAQNYNIGIQLLREHRGRGYAAPAQRLFADYLFANKPIMRVEATTDVENVAERRALTAAGFTLEGVLRSVHFRAGKYHDYAVFSRLRSDP